MTLIEYVASVRNAQPTHCAYFAAEAVEHMTGKSVIPDGVTGNKARDMIVLKRMGYNDHLDFVRQNFTLTDKPKAGDVVILEDDGEGIVGILQGRGVYVMSDAGLVIMPRSHIKEAFTP